MNDTLSLMLPEHPSEQEIWAAVRNAMQHAQANNKDIVDVNFTWFEQEGLPRMICVRFIMLSRVRPFGYGDEYFAEWIRTHHGDAAHYWLDDERIKALSMIPQWRYIGDTTS